MACVPKWAWPRCKAETDLPHAAFVLGARNPPAFWLQPAPDFPAASRARDSLQRWEKIPGLGLWSLGEPRRLAFWRTCSLGLPCPRAVTVGPTSRPPLREMACTYYTVTCTHSEDVDVAMGPVQHIHSSVCRTTVARYTHTLHTHTPCTHTHSIHSRVPLHCTATFLPRQNPAGSGELSAASPGPSAALSAPLFLSPQWGRGRVCQQRGQFPAGILCPQQLPKAREGWATSSQAPGSGLLGSPGRNHS